MATRNSELVRLLVEKGKNILVKRNDAEKTTILRAPEKSQVTELVDEILEEGNRIIVLDTFDFCTPLHNAARHGHNYTLQSLLEMGADTGIKDIRGWTALHHATWEGNKLAVRLLLEKGSDPNIQDTHGMAPLHLASNQGYKVIVGLLLASGANVALADTRGWTPVEMRTLQTNDDLTSFLLKQSGPDFKGSLDQTALHFAAILGDTVTAAMFLDNGVDIDAQDSIGSTALHDAASLGSSDFVKFLLERGANVDIQDDDGFTPLHVALAGAPPEHTESVAMALLDKGANVNIPNNIGDTVFERLGNFLATESDRSILEKLLDRADTNLRTRVYKRTTLHIAAHYTSWECVQSQLEKGVDVNYQDADGWSALHFAAIWPNCDVKIRLLLDAGADIAANTNDQMTPIDIAYEFGEMKAPLLESADTSFRTKETDQTILHLAVQIGNRRLAKIFIDKGVDIDHQDPQGRTALHYAAFALEKSMVKLLMDNGADNTIEDKHGLTPLRELLQLVEEGSCSGEFVGLLAKGLDLDARDSKGFTLLDLAMRHGHQDAMRALQEMVIEREVRDSCTVVRTGGGRPDWGR